MELKAIDQTYEFESLLAKKEKTTLNSILISISVKAKYICFHIFLTYAVSLHNTKTV